MSTRFFFFLTNNLINSRFIRKLLSIYHINTEVCNIIIIIQLRTEYSNQFIVQDFKKEKIKNTKEL